MLSNGFLSKKDIHLKERTFQAISDLETEIKAIHSLRSRLKSSVNDSLFAAMKVENKEKSLCYIDEYNDLTNLLAIVRSAEMLLQNLSVKIDSVRYLQELVTILDSATRSVHMIKFDISRLLPAVNSALDMINGTIVEMKDVLRIDAAKQQSCELPFTIPDVNVKLPTIQNRSMLLVQ
ncbi:MAG: hypothetical protein QXU32_08065 [Nitrososphaerales archaeon]